MEEYKTNSSLCQRIGEFLYTSARFCSQIFLNRYFFLLLFCLAGFFSVTDRQVIGAVVFVGIICVALIFCNDIFATTLPFLLLCVFVTECYNSYDAFIKYAWFAIPAVFSIFFHFIVYRQTIRIGNTFWGLIGVSIALVLGGISFISPSEYFRPMTLYYTAFLGIGMIVAYVLLKSQMCAKRDYDPKEKFLSMLYIMGILSCLVVIVFFAENFSEIRNNKILPFWQPSNNISTFLMIALPCPLFFALRNRAHLFSFVLMFSCILCTGSRAGIILGTIEFFLCLIMIAIWDTPHRFFYVCCTVTLVGFFAVSGEKILHFSTNTAFENLVSTEEARFLLIGRAKTLFLEHPLFGHGLGYSGNTDLYSPVKGAMAWYHMMIPQIMGSMGILGILAYAFQFVLQIRATLIAMWHSCHEQRGMILTLAMAYMGLLLMSQLNPGIFCPLPYTLIGTMIFALFDGNNGCEWLYRLKRK